MVERCEKGVSSKIIPSTPTPRTMMCPSLRCRANMAHIRQTRPDAGLSFQVKPCKVFPLCSEAVPANVQRFRGRLVCKAHRLCVSLNSRLESNKEEEGMVNCVLRAVPMSSKLGTYKTVKARNKTVRPEMRQSRPEIRQSRPGGYNFVNV